MDAIDVLIKYWGHTQFRLKQKEIINQVIDKKDILALLPTGGGKSICYQVPTLMQEGVCLVISPLIALMDDQVRFLKSKGIKSIAITSGMHYNEIDTALTNCIYGGVKFLYLSPERLQNELVQTRIKEMKINLITVDEAHCISEWGHNFRPAYRHISEIREIIPEVPILALTATATTSVIDDIQNNLEFKEHNLIQSTFIRENLSYVVDNIESKKLRLLKLVEKIKSPVIVYVGSRKAAKEITEFLIANNYSANYYHGGLTAKIRTERQGSWTKNQTRIMVATNAFGMGIDKGDVKLVVHMELPSTIEAYFQEAGRSGRNGEQAYAFLLANKTDIKKQKDLLKLRYPTINEIKQVYQKLANYLQLAENILPMEPLPFDIVDFSERYKISNLKTYNILKYLEKEEHLKLSDAVHSPSKLMVIISNSDLYKFQIANQYYDSFIKLLLRSYANLFNNYVVINETEIARRFNISDSEVKRLLNKLMQLEILRYLPKNNNGQITYLKERKDIDFLYLDEKKWEDRKQYEEEKLTKISNYITEKKECRSKLLLHYFGEEESKKCGKCDFCIYEKRKKIKEVEYQKITNKLADILQNKELTIEEICIALPSINEQQLINIIQFLFDNDKIGKFGNKYQWKGI
ncbi:MAG: RecQ family ATP-dependent DNA helicase [Flavobacteriales bacterium]|nr:RecQ family ATP-dependent DNA helicase [Flavobacteriales bacterium]MBT4881748.1 RecQ family ATP-dependent DNA helicase [Flavobacteriales bacterium]MDG1349066.1 RecQ family ATP-dependent DNA helicase [Flavobacteriales bacterium]